MFLTDAELRELTGYLVPAAQARWLEERGWRFERNRAGRVIVSRAHAESMMGGAAPKVAGPKPNFAAIGGSEDDALSDPGWMPPWLAEPWHAEGKRPMQWIDEHFNDYLVTKDEVIERALGRAEWELLPDHGFYFLTRPDVIVYVGISERTHWRLEQHWASQKNFSRAYAIAAPEVVAKQMEAFYYEAWRPEANVRREWLANDLRHRLPK